MTQLMKLTGHLEDMGLDDAATKQTLSPICNRVIAEYSLYRLQYKLHKYRKDLTTEKESILRSAKRAKSLLNRNPQLCTAIVCKIYTMTNNIGFISDFIEHTLTPNDDTIHSTDGSTPPPTYRPQLFERDRIPTQDPNIALSGTCVVRL